MWGGRGGKCGRTGDEQVQKREASRGARLAGLERRVEHVDVGGEALQLKV
jgi:hypothetical protein